MRKGIPNMPITPLSRPDWARFTPKMQWDIKVSLRGPDVDNSQMLKWFTTSVIRGKMREVTRVGGLINTDLNLVVIPISNSTFNGYSRYGSPPSDLPPCSCERCAWLTKRLHKEAGVLRWDCSHFFHHIQEASAILGIPCVAADPLIYREVFRTGSLSTATATVLNAIDTSYQSEREELKRHLDNLLTGKAAANDY